MRALDLLESGRPVPDMAASLGIAQPCLYREKQHDLPNRGITSQNP
ncbi:hypothetical protein BCF44_14120 [Kutzneria buriramensis]|uniref:Uncharacterized protein n=1 Tax=Kutzneria buriramensis TaxID=1045776 RepID=A0A3E0G616_9PSEU|nr:hypothetical protein BCF44_14120 [Kutzneria buriramensis]